MPTVQTRTKTRRGAERKCGAPGCGQAIQPGEKYYRWAFRYGGTHYRCHEHPPKQSELTQSKMSTVYAALEDAEATLRDAASIEDIVNAVHEAGDTVQEVVEEYREAAEHFGGAGENAERADELESFADELTGWEAEDEMEEDLTEEEALDTAREQASETLGSCPL